MMVALMIRKRDRVDGDRYTMGGDEVKGK